MCLLTEIQSCPCVVSLQGYQTKGFKIPVAQMIGYTAPSWFLLIKPRDSMLCMGSFIFPSQKLMLKACTPPKYLKSLNVCSGKGKNAGYSWWTVLSASHLAVSRFLVFWARGLTEELCLKHTYTCKGKMVLGSACPLQTSSPVFLKTILPQQMLKGKACPFFSFLLADNEKITSTSEICMEKTLEKWLCLSLSACFSML